LDVRGQREHWHGEDERHAEAAPEVGHHVAWWLWPPDAVAPGLAP
jgi:hypothetical protein